MSERQGVEIDYCPECRGVWLDRGELDKLIAGEERAYAGNQQSAPDNQRYVDDNHNNRHSHDDRHGSAEQNENSYVSTLDLRVLTDYINNR